MYLNIEKQDTKQPFKPQEISNIVWGLANLEMFLDGINPELTEEFLINFIRRIDLEVFPPQELNNAVWVRSNLYISTYYTSVCSFD